MKFLLLASSLVLLSSNNFASTDSFIFNQKDLTKHRNIPVFNSREEVTANTVLVDNLPAFVKYFSVETNCRTGVAATVHDLQWRGYQVINAYCEKNSDNTYQGVINFFQKRIN